MNVKLKIKNLKLKIILSFLYFHSLVFLYNCYSEDRILAVVNNEIVTQKDLENFTNFMKLQTQRVYSQKELLERLIEDRLILQSAYKEGLKVEEDKIKRRIEEIKKKYPSEEEFKNFLIQEGLSLADLELKLKEQILMYDIIDKKIRSKIFISPQEITDYYLNHLKEFIRPEERKLSVLNIEDLDLANKIKEELSFFKNFEEISLKYSLEIREIGWMKKEQLRPEISEILFSLRKEEFSPLLSLDGRYYIFKVEEISEEEKISLKDVQEEIFHLLFEEKMKIKLDEWLEELKKNSYIKINEG